jgi:glycosyltransferase involved in cell wall biosynthesis
VENQQPFFTIGVPTYNRHGLLIKALKSILFQDFTDFEIIVGNDYTDELLTGEMLGIKDPRICFVNHPVNLKEVGNMNALLAKARGRYFTWLFDDDLFEPNLLQTAHNTLVTTDYPDAFFSSYRLLFETVDYPPLAAIQTDPALFTGEEFILRYSATNPDVISTCGFYRTVMLRESVGGFRALSDTVFGLYSEYLLLVHCGLLDRIVFINTPLVTFRIHSESWGEINFELQKYPILGKELIKKCASVLQHPRLTEVYRSVLLEICKTHLFTYYHKSVQYELAHNKSKISRAVRYRLRYYREIYYIWKLYADLTGYRPSECLPFFLHMANHYHIFPPVWDSPAQASVAP